MERSSPPSHASLRRELGVGGATLLGLGSMLGTGVFVSIGLAAGIAGPGVLLAIIIAGLVAGCNASSSAQLAASHPVSGGTYEYGYRYLSPTLGFTAGWMFLFAKSASAATAALGCAGYLISAVAPSQPSLLVPIALALVGATTAVVMTGARRSSAVNVAIVAVAVGSLIAVAGAAVPLSSPENWTPFLTPLEGSSPLSALFHATALMFVAYTGYGRVATLGEEVHHPRRTIPRAILTTLGVTALIYVLVAAASVSAVGAPALGEATTATAAPLETVALATGRSWLPAAVAVGAMTAMLGVLLNLVLGLSRVAMAMGRRGDLPERLATLDASRRTPRAAVLLVAFVVAVLAATGKVETTWSFSAFTVLVYYAITNLAALRLDPADRLYPRAFAGAGLAGCLFLAFWVEPTIWMVGLGVIAAGLLWHTGRRRHRTA